ncbi:MAG: Rrf2 family transcriptional regulator [Firmicutes bacterium]|nr:Rrf2 family transcriptional regulator [Bacillota bacterium]
MIGTQNESSLHASLKEHYFRPGDIVEGRVGGYHIDLIQAERLVEIQTQNFSSIKAKLANLLEEHHVHLVYPITLRRDIVKVAPETGEFLSTRKSPKKEDVYDLFSELIRIPHLILHPHLTVEAVFIKEREVRCEDGKGSWRRRGASIVDRTLAEVVDKRAFASALDYLSLLPEDLLCPFTNKQLASSVKISQSKAQKTTYTLRKAGLLVETGRKGNEILHTRA